MGGGSSLEAGGEEPGSGRPPPPRLAPCFSCSSSPSPAPTPGPRVCHLSEEQSLPLGGWREQVTLTPARAGTQARAAWAGGSLAGRTWLALLCLQPLPPDSLINDPQRPGGSARVSSPVACAAAKWTCPLCLRSSSAAFPDGPERL